MEKKSRTHTEKLRFMSITAVIAAFYAALTYAAAMLNLAYGPIQFRFSEALTILPVFTPAAIPGLVIGCFIANLASPFGPVDWIFGTTASLLAACGTWMVAKIRVKSIAILAPLPPILFNMLIIGFEIACFSQANEFAFSNFTMSTFIASAFSVGVGQAVVCYGLGIPLMIALEKTKVFEKLKLNRNSL